MKASQTLRRPSNWQDFETLCKKLWGEIWKCPEIQKNGRLGQDQSGVDIFGTPINEDSYYGIQCKGKTEYNDNQYNHPQFTEKEINEEIEKAKYFTPPLKKLYFATTALNDSNIQSYIRKKNIEHKKQGSFEVHLFSWETIVDLIDENKHTHDWYLKSQNFKSNKSVSVTFHDNSNELAATVTFKQLITDFRQQAIPANSPFGMPNFINERFRNINLIVGPPYFINNHSFFSFSLRLHNTGEDPIEDFKIRLRFEGEYQDLETPRNGNSLINSSIRYTYDTFIDKENKTGKIIPTKKILVSDDIIGFDEIRIKPLNIETIIIIHWNLISKDFKDEGQLKLALSPEVRKVYKTVLVEDPMQVRIETGEIEDYITSLDKK